MVAPLTFIAVFGLRAQMAFFEHAGIPITEEKVVQEDYTVMAGRTEPA